MEVMVDALLHSEDDELYTQNCKGSSVHPAMWVDGDLSFMEWCG